MRFSAQHFRVIGLIGCLAPSAHASTTGSVSIVSDYLSYGISQSDEEPSLQLGVNWSGESGIYVSGWASNVDYSDGTRQELDGYIGYLTPLAENCSLDMGTGHFTYHGSRASSDLDYGEIYTTLSTPLADLSLRYSWDYFGTGAGYTIFQLAKSINLPNKIGLKLGYNYSTSLNTEKYTTYGDKFYSHAFAKLSKNWGKLNWELSIQDTDLNAAEVNGVKVVLGTTLNF